MSFLNFRINLLLAELTISTVAKVILFVGGLCISSSVNFAFQGTPPLRIRSVAWSPDGSMIAVGGGPSQCDPNNPSAFAVQVLDSTTGQLLQSLAGATCSVNSVDWSPDGAKVVAASGDAFGVRVWDIQSGQILMTIQSGGQGTTSVRWHPNGAKLAVATVSNLVVLVDPMTGNVLDLAPIGGLDVDWNPDGSKLVSGSAYDNKIYAADMMVNQEILAIDMELVAAIDWSPDGTKWVTGSADGTVHIWNATSGEVFLTLLGHNELVTSVRWSWDNTQIASASNDGTVRIWDAVTGQQLNTIYSTGRVSAVDWSPDGSQIAFGGIDNTLHIVDPFMFSPTPTFTPTATFTLTPTLTLPHCQVLRLYLRSHPRRQSP